MNLALLALGGAISVTNFALSFVRIPLLRARGVPRERIRFVSGFPVLGSALVAAALVLGLESRAARVAAWILILIDTGGLHWFAAVLLRQTLGARGEKPSA